MKSDNSIEDMIVQKGLVAPRVTAAHIDELAGRVSHTYEVQGTSTFCHGFLDGKYYLASGHSACVSPENFDEGVGRTVAFANMVTAMRNKLWELEGYHLYKTLQGNANV